MRDQRIYLCRTILRLERFRRSRKVLDVSAISSTRMATLPWISPASVASTRFRSARDRFWLYYYARSAGVNGKSHSTLAVQIEKQNKNINHGKALPCCTWFIVPIFLFCLLFAFSVVAVFRWVH